MATFNLWSSLRSKKTTKPATNGRLLTISNSIDSTATLPTDAQGVLRSSMLVWLDTNWNSSDPDCQKSMATLQSIISSVHPFKDVKKFKEFIAKNKNKQVFMIASGSLGQQVVPSIEPLPQIDSIYIFCVNKAYHETWALRHPKVKGVYTDIQSICNSLQKNHKTSTQDIIPISFNQLDPSFMYTQLFKDAILQIRDDDEREIQRMVHFCRQRNGVDLQQLERIERDYKKYSPIWWYKNTTFMHLILNIGLDRMDTDIILNMQVFIRDLYQEIEKYNSEQKNVLQSKLGNTFSVYLGQEFSRAQFEQLTKSKGQLIGFNSFLCASLNPNVVLKHNVLPIGSKQIDAVGVVFIMHIDTRICNKSNISYAHINETNPNHEKEDEIIFTTHTIFRIFDIRPLRNYPSDRLWQVELTLITPDGNEFDKLTTHLKDETIGTGWGRIGMILLKIGQPKQAEQVYQTLLQSTLSEEEQSNTHYQLGWVYDELGEYDKSIKSYLESMEISKKILPEDDPYFSHIYNNIGLVYYNMRDYEKALESHRKSLDIREKTLPKNHPDLAISYNNIGSMYYQSGYYVQAIKFHEKGIEIQKQVLPSSHPDLASSYDNLGNIHSSMGKYSEAFQLYQRALDIRIKSLPSNHPDLGKSYANIGLLYEEQKNYSKAMSNLQAAYDIWRRSLRSVNPNMQSITIHLNRVKRKI